MWANWRQKNFQKSGAPNSEILLHNFREFVQLTSKSDARSRDRASQRQPKRVVDGLTECDRESKRSSQGDTSGIAREETNGVFWSRVSIVGRRSSRVFSSDDRAKVTATLFRRKNCGKEEEGRREEGWSDQEEGRQEEDREEKEVAFVAVARH
jgi:hypothetical protein